MSIPRKLKKLRPLSKITIIRRLGSLRNWLQYQAIGDEDWSRWTIALTQAALRVK